MPDISYKLTYLPRVIALCRADRLATQQEFEGLRDPQRFRFFVFTHRDPRHDFRRPLVEALRLRYETYYIWIKRQPVISGPRQNDAPVQVSVTELLRFFWRFRQHDKINIYFNSTSTATPLFTSFLRLIADDGVWCLDLHDDLRYDYSGMKRLQARLGVSVMQFFSDVSVHASPQLKELFPHSHHLGNASHILPLARDVARDKVLVIASFDERIDLEFLSRVAQLCPATEFHLHGWTGGGIRHVRHFRQRGDLTQQQISAICERNANIRYFGPYTPDDLPTILRQFHISLAPFNPRNPMTRYIDPLRFYHCLNSGMEVVTTTIPQAARMKDWVHVAHDPIDCARILNLLRSGELSKREVYTPITWDQRTERLVEIVGALPRTQALERKRL